MGLLVVQEGDKSGVSIRHRREARRLGEPCEGPSKRAVAKWPRSHNERALHAWYGKGTNRYPSRCNCKSDPEGCALLSWQRGYRAVENAGEAGGEVV